MMLISQSLRTRIVVCIWLVVVFFQGQVTINAQQVEKKVITAENAKQLRMIKRMTIGNDYILFLSAATKENLVAMVIESYEASGLKHNIYLYDLDTYRVVNQFDRNDLGSVNIGTVKLGEDGTYLAIGVNSTGSASMWNSRESRKLYDIETDHKIDYFGGFDFSSDGQFFAVTNNVTDNYISVIEIREVKTGKVLKVLKGDPDSYDSYAAVAISEDQRYVAAASTAPLAAIIDVWDLKTGNRVRTLKGHTNRITKVLFTPDSKSVVSEGGDADATIRVWDVGSGKMSSVMKTQPPNVDIAVSPQGNLLASIVEDGFIHLWDLATGQELTQLRDLTLTLELDTESLMNLAFSADGTKIIVGEITGKVQIWGIP